jgi:hypothetical protein
MTKIQVTLWASVDVLALEGLYDNHLMNALPNVLNSQWEYFIVSHCYNGCPK